VPAVGKFASGHSLLPPALIDLRFPRSARYLNDELDQEFHSGPPPRFDSLSLLTTIRDGAGMMRGGLARAALWCYP
jgi:hypothetical protein